MVTTYQVFPITSETIEGTVTIETLKTERLIKALADGIITFHYDAGDLAVAVLAGQDFYVHDEADCDTITSSADVLMS